jgi:hypothetical protein
MGVNDYGTAQDPTTTPSLADWAADVAAALDGSDASVDTRIADHAAAADPHPGYMTPAETAQALLLYAPLESPALTGNPTAPTPVLTDNDTSIATTAFVAGYAAAKATAGNLLTDNQASGTDTLGTTAGFYSDHTISSVSDSTCQGSKAIQLTATADNPMLAFSGSQYAASGVAVSGTGPFTAMVTTWSTGIVSGSFRIVFYPWSSAGANLGTIVVTTAPVASGSTTKHSATVNLPLGTVSVAVCIQMLGGVTGNSFRADAFSFHAGAGGQWAMPGTPITNLGTKVSHPNVDDVLVQRWDEGLGRWQTVHYDSGIRNIDSLWASGFSGFLQISRDGFGTCTVYISMPTTTPVLVGGWNTIATLPEGFRPYAGTSFVWMNAGTTLGRGSISNTGAIQLFGGGAAASAIAATVTFRPLSTLPTSLPGALFSPAPA